MAGINLDALKAEHAKFVRAHESMTKGELQSAGEIAKQHVLRVSTFKRRRASGSLKDDTRYTTTRVAGGFRIRLMWTKHYAAHIEFGTQEHDIPQRGGPSVFFWPKVGHWVTFTVARPAKHPGTKPYKFGSQAAQFAHHRLKSMLLDGMRRVAK